ncbi:MAG TPA: hypothetical protein VNY73_00300, partial [Bacteroidia bacterium]|nr:hypothetical protein [Bacteroidia bacterium]
MSRDKSSKKPFSRAEGINEKKRIDEILKKPPEAVAIYVYRLEKMYDELEATNLELKSKVKNLSSELETQRRLNKGNDNNKKNPANKYVGYDKSKTGVEKVRFIIERNKKKMTFLDVKTTLLLLEPELKERWGNIDKSVTDLLFKANKYGLISRAKEYG